MEPARDEPEQDRFGALAGLGRVPQWSRLGMSRNSGTVPDARSRSGVPQWSRLGMSRNSGQPHPTAGSHPTPQWSRLGMSRNSMHRNPEAQRPHAASMEPARDEPEQPVADDRV